MDSEENIVEVCVCGGGWIGSGGKRDTAIEKGLDYVTRLLETSQWPLAVTMKSTSCPCTFQFSPPSSHARPSLSLSAYLVSCTCSFNYKLALYSEQLVGRAVGCESPLLDCNSARALDTSSRLFTRVPSTWHIVSCAWCLLIECLVYLLAPVFPTNTAVA